MTARILAVDPGSDFSAFVFYDPIARTILGKGKLPNRELNAMLNEATQYWPGVSKLYVEMIASYGMPVGAEVFDTCVWIGRFIESWQGEYERIYRKDVKLGLCHSLRANDSNIRARLIDLFGPGRERAIGLKKNPGPLYGVTQDVWAALAVAVYATERLTHQTRASMVGNSSVGST